MQPDDRSRGCLLNSLSSEEAVAEEGGSFGRHSSVAVARAYPVHQGSARKLGSHLLKDVLFWFSLLLISAGWFKHSPPNVPIHRGQGGAAQPRQRWPCCGIECGFRLLFLSAEQEQKERISGEWCRTRTAGIASERSREVCR